MKMNKVNGSGFPSWLFSRFKKQEEVIPENKTIAEDFDSPCSIQDEDEIQNDMSSETDTKAGNEIPNEKNSEISMMEFGIDYSEDSVYNKNELENPVSEDKKSNAQPDNCAASEKRTETIDIPATINDVLNIGSGLSNVDPLEILDQLGSIHKKRSKKHKQHMS